MRKTMLVFLGIFFFMIYAVPISQAIVELSRGSRIQALELVVDAVATPIGRAKTEHRILESIRNQLDSLGVVMAQAKPDSTSVWDPQNALDRIDNIMGSAGDLSRAVHTINRHVDAKPGSREMTRVTTYVSSFDSLLSSAHAADIGATKKQMESEIAATDRLLTTYPSPTIPGRIALIVTNLPTMFWDANFLRPYGKEMENASIFATSILPVMFFFKYALFGDLGEKAIPGIKGWFFYKFDVDYLIRPYVLDKSSVVVDANGKVLTDNPLTAITTFKKQLADMGINLIVVLMPAKPSIYPDLMNHSISPAMSGKIGTTPRMIEALRARGVDAIDLFTAFAKERQNDSLAGDSLYLSKDTHWKTRAVLLAAHIVAERIKQYPWYQDGTTEYVMDTVTIDRVGDIGVMTTLPSVKIRQLRTFFPTEKTTCYQVFKVYRDATGNVTDRVLYKDDFTHSKVLVLGDSYSRIYQTDEPRSAGWISHIARDLKQPVASLVSDGGASTLVRESLARRSHLLKGKKVVVWEIVERDLRYGDEGWKDVPITVATK